MMKRCPVHGCWYSDPECPSCAALAKAADRGMTRSERAGFDIEECFALIDAGKLEEAAEWERRWREAVPELEPLSPEWQEVADAMMRDGDGPR